MTHQGMRRRDKNYGDSPVRRSGVPITSSVLESCSLLPTLAASRRFASATRGTASRLPFGSTVESWPPQPSACPATQPPLCRALLMQPAITASVGIARAASSKDRISQSSAYPGRNSFSTSPKAARTFSWERTANPPSHTRWISR